MFTAKSRLVLDQITQHHSLVKLAIKLTITVVEKDLFRVQDRPVKSTLQLSSK